MEREVLVFGRLHQDALRVSPSLDIGECESLHERTTSRCAAAHTQHVFKSCSFWLRPNVLCPLGSASSWVMEPRPDKKGIFGAELRYAFVPAIRKGADDPYPDSPLNVELPLLLISSGMKPNYHGKSRTEMKDEGPKKDLLLRGELVEASDHELYVFVGAVCGYYPMAASTPNKVAMPMKEWCPDEFAFLFREKGQCRAILWRGGTELFHEVRLCKNSIIPFSSALDAPFAAALLAC